MVRWMMVALVMVAGIAMAMEAKSPLTGKTPGANLKTEKPSKIQLANATYQVEGWHCESCTGKTDEALKKTNGVLKVALNLEKGTCEVAYDPNKVKPEQLAMVIAKDGYKATQKTEAKKPKTKTHGPK